jgi:SAM-dependent methyltransferase
MPDLYFRTDLYQGVAHDYDRYRPPYPRSLFDDLIERTAPAPGPGSSSPSSSSPSSPSPSSPSPSSPSDPGSRGRLLDLACGTGQITFALHDRFAEVWAVDQEPGMVALVKKKAAAAGIGNIRGVVSAAQDLPAADESFDLVASGNAFHRLPRAAVAALILRWLRPGGYLALLWGGGPWGDEPWQRAIEAVRDRWWAELGGQRIPAEWEEDRKQRPDPAILAEAGFEVLGKREFPVARDWTVEELAGYQYSTSILTRGVLGDRIAEFEADVRRALLAIEPSGVVRQTITFELDLARRPR